VRWHATLLAHVVWRLTWACLAVLLACAGNAVRAQGTGGAAPEVAAGWNAALQASQAVIGQPLGSVETMMFTDHQNRQVTLADLRGKPVVVSFVYTGCYQACPVATQGLMKAVAAARTALGADGFHVLSIGFNQPFDTPDAMGAFARQARIVDERWRFLSPRTDDVPALLRAFGFSYTATPKGFDHITQATIVDARGVVAAQVYGDSIDLPQFIGPLKAVMSGEAAQRLSVENIWLKVKLYCTVYDASSGNYKLNYSLFFELFCGATVLGALAWFMLRELRRSRST
jgi:protein SCO1/2